MIMNTQRNNIVNVLNINIIHLLAILLLLACCRSAEAGDAVVDLFPRKIQNPVRLDLLVRRINDPVRSGCVKSKQFVGNCNKKFVRLCSNVSRPRLNKDMARQNGFYYGLGLDVLDSISDSTLSILSSDTSNRKGNKKKKSLLLAETIDELRESLDELRQELKFLREFQSQMLLKGSEGGIGSPFGESPMIKVNRRQEQFDNIAKSVEVWAEKLLFEEDEDHGWSFVQCNKMFKNKFNPDDTIQCFLKWMPDSREQGPDVELLKGGVFPCLKMYATLDASYDQVCQYLANGSNLPEYNDLVVKSKDVEEIDSHSKICWGQSPQILFIKPRDFVTFCHHRWKKDGAQVVINQAIEHESMPGITQEENGNACRAYAIRGANSKFLPCNIFLSMLCSSY